MIAVTPSPPAAQIEITPRPEPFSASAFASPATMPPARRAERVSGAKRAAVHVEPLAVDRANGLLETQAVAAEHRVLPGLQRAQHLGGERLVDLVEVEVLQREPRPREHRRHCVRGRHQQALLLANVVDAGGLGAGEVRLHRNPALGRPRFAREQHRGGTVAEWCRVSGRHRPLRPTEHGIELGELLQARICSQVLITLESEKRRHEVIEEALVVRGRQTVVTAHGELVLLLTADPPLARHQRRVLAHREAGARLRVLRDRGHDLLRPQLRQRTQPPAVRLGPLGLEQYRAEVLVERDRRVRGRVRARGDPALDLPERDLVRDEDRGLEARPARLLDVVGRCLSRELGPEHRFTGEIEITAVLEHGARGYLAEDLPLEVELRCQRVERCGQHVLVGRRRVRPVLTCERDPNAPENRHTVGVNVHQTAPGFGLLQRCRLARRGRRELSQSADDLVAVVNPPPAVPRRTSAGARIRSAAANQYGRGT